MPSEKSSLAIDAEETQQFLQSAVHDLRAMQRRTGVAAELLVQASNDLERRDLTEQVLQSLSKTEDLLIGIGRYANALTPARYSITTFSATSAVRFATTHLDREIRETGATLIVGNLPEISGDRDRIAELFEHLIANALKFKGPDATIVSIDARRGPAGWLFSIKDNGVGIPPKYRNRLFTAFRRLHGTEVPGAGLGLAISRKIVEAHGGRIWIEDSDEPGVTISFTLPALDGD
jgi:light-regulated signal transduction histidine kinase (bacteriophytochrome)